MDKYYLVPWPESQEFMGREDCYICTEEDGAVFVPENLYEKGG